MNALRENKHILINAVLFQILWFVSVLGQTMWSLIPLGLMFAHLVFIRKPQSPCVLLLLVLAIIGIALDSIYHYIGVYQFTTESLTLAYFEIPIWLACLWLGFCFTLPVSLAWLVKMPYLFIIACTLLGPLSFLAGRNLGAVNFSDSNLYLLALEWCVFSFIALIFLFPKLGMSKASLGFFKKETLC